MPKLRGAGLPDVALLEGVVRGPGDEVAYRDLDGLYRALAEAIAMRSGALTAHELRFLRKRLNLTQEDVATLGGKTAQMAAKWEKGTAPVPLAESTMLRLVWLERHAKHLLAAAVKAFADIIPRSAPGGYVMRYVEGEGWREEIEPAPVTAKRQREMQKTKAVRGAMAKKAAPVSAGAMFAVSGPARNTPAEKRPFRKTRQSPHVR